MLISEHLYKGQLSDRVLGDRLAGTLLEQKKGLFMRK